MKYRLNKAEKVPVTLYNVAKTRNLNGRDVVTYTNYIRLVPGEEYETDDVALSNWLAAYRRKVKHSKSVEDALVNGGVPYNIELCRSCGGRVRKIIYNPVEVYDE